MQEPCTHPRVQTSRPYLLQTSLSQLRLASARAEALLRVQHCTGGRGEFLLVPHDFTSEAK